MHGREEVHAQDTARPLRPRRDVPDGQGGGVAGDDARLARRRLRLRQYPPLQLEVLEDGLDHEVGPPEAPVVEGRREPVHAPAHLARGQALPLLALVEEAAHVGEATAEGLGRRVLEPNRQPRLGRGPRDARAHEARAQDRHLADLQGLRGRRRPRILLYALGGKEDGHEGARSVGDRESSEGRGLELQALGQAGGGPLLDHGNGFEGGRVVTTRLGQHPGPGLPEDQGAQRALVQADSRPPRHQPPLGQRRRRLAGHHEQEGRGYDLVDQARLERPRGLQAAPGQDQVESGGQADEAGQPLRSSRTGQQPQSHLGQTEHGLRVIGGNAVAARERQLESAAQARPVDGRHHRHSRSLQPVEHGVGAPRQGLALEGARDGREVLDVGPGHEVVGLAARDHHRLEAGVRFDDGEDLVELRHQALAQRVQLLSGHVEGEHQHAVVAALAAEGTTACGHRLHPRHGRGAHCTTPALRMPSISEAPKPASRRTSSVWAPKAGAS